MNKLFNPVVEYPALVLAEDKQPTQKGKHTMSIAEFVENNRQKIDEHIISVLGSVGAHRYPDDEERELWVMNDEGLYNWAKSVGVEV